MRGSSCRTPGTGVSALLLKEAGFEAIGTSSAALAASLGRLDGRHALSRDEHIANAVLLNDMTGLPINGDFEDGYGSTPADVAATVQAAIERAWPGSASRTPPATPTGPSATSTRRSHASPRPPRRPRDGSC